MDFFTAHQTLWRLRSESPLASQQADLVSYLLLLSHQQDRLASFSCTAPADVLLLALGQSARNLRRLKAELTESGWLATAADNEWVLRFPALCKRFKLSVAPPAVLTRRQKAAKTATDMRVIPIKQLPQEAAPPVLVLTPAPNYLNRLVPDEHLTEADVVSTLLKKPLIVNGSGVNLRYAESLEACHPLQAADLKTFEAWQAVEAPKLAKLEQRITAHQLSDLYRKFPPALLAHVMRQMDNKKNVLRLYSKAHRTIENWCGMEWNTKAVANSEVVDENPLPATLLFLVHEAQQAATTTGNLFAAPAVDAALPSMYKQAMESAQDRASLFNWNTDNA